MFDAFRRVGRQAVAIVRNVFRSARRERADRTWTDGPVAGENAIQEDLDSLLARSRDLAINSATAKRISECLSDLIVGSGILAYVQPFEGQLERVLKDELSRDELIRNLVFSQEINRRFQEWAEYADADGDSDWSELERQACHEMIKTGDAILLECFERRPGRPIPLCFQLIEKDQLDRTLDRPGGPGENRIINGIEYNGRNQKVAYHIYTEHPGSERASFKSTRIPSRRIIHAFMRFRPSQRSGYPWHQEAFQAISDGDWFLSSVLKKAAIEALLILALKSPRHNRASGLLDGLTSNDDYGNVKIKMGSAMLSRLGTEDSLEAFESKQSGQNMSPFLAEIRAEQGMGGGISPARLTRDYRNHSYTSARAAHLDDDAHIKPLQQFVAKKISIPVHRRVNEWHAAMGLYQAMNAAEFFANFRRYQAFQAIGPGREHLDPSKDTEPALRRVNGGISTLAAENAKLQQFWIDVLTQRKYETELIAELGVMVDLSKGAGDPTANQSSQRADEDDTAEDDDERASLGAWNMVA